MRSNEASENLGKRSALLPRNNHIVRRGLHGCVHGCRAALLPLSGKRFHHRSRWDEIRSLSPASDDFAATVQARIDEIHAAHPEKGDEPIPSDLVTNSGSGFDPHISPAAAEYQVERLAKNTGKTPSEIRAIIEQCTEQPQFGILGDARVNVLKVNLMLDGILQ